MEENKKLIIVLYAIITLCIITLIIFLIPITITKIKEKNNYEVTFYVDEFNIDYDDDKSIYDIFADNTHYYVYESKIKTMYDDQDTYIIILVNEYSWQYNEAYLFINVKKLQEEG